MPDKDRVNISLPVATKARLAEIGGGPRKLGEAIKMLLDHFDATQHQNSPISERVNILERQVEELQKFQNKIAKNLGIPK